MAMAEKVEKVGVSGDGEETAVRKIEFLSPPVARNGATKRGPPKGARADVPTPRPSSSSSEEAGTAKNKPSPKDSEIDQSAVFEKFRNLIEQMETRLVSRLEARLEEVAPATPDAKFAEDLEREKDERKRRLLHAKLNEEYAAYFPEEWGKRAQDVRIIEEQSEMEFKRIVPKYTNSLPRPMKLVRNARTDRLRLDPKEKRFLETELPEKMEKNDTIFRFLNELWTTTANLYASDHVDEYAKDALQRWMAMFTNICCNENHKLVKKGQNYIIDKVGTRQPKEVRERKVKDIMTDAFTERMGEEAEKSRDMIEMLQISRGRTVRKRDGDVRTFSLTKNPTRRGGGDGPFRGGTAKVAVVLGTTARKETENPTRVLWGRGKGKRTLKNQQNSCMRMAPRAASGDTQASS